MLVQQAFFSLWKCTLIGLCRLGACKCARDGEHAYKCELSIVELHTQLAIAIVLSRSLICRAMYVT
jgi:hypothetical protein